MINYNSNNQITFRSVQPNDFDQLKALHEELFPVKYKDSFYRDICNGLHKDYAGNDKGKIDQQNLKSQINDDIQLPFTYSIIAVQHKQHEEEIVGFLLGQICLVTSCEDTYLFSQEKEEDVACYILTLGTKQSHRREKLGTKLINMCTEFCKSKPNCASVYLHVIDYNKEAIQFYKSNQFQCIRKLNDFYKIDNVYYSSYLYILYLNGRQPPFLLRFINETKHTFYLNESYFNIIIRSVTEFTIAYISSLISSIIPRSVNNFITNIFSSSVETNKENRASDIIERSL